MPTFCLIPRHPDLATPTERTILCNKLYLGKQTHPKGTILSVWKGQGVPQADGDSDWKRVRKMELRNVSLPWRSFFLGICAKKNQQQTNNNNNLLVRATWKGLQNVLLNADWGKGIGPSSFYGLDFWVFLCRAMSWTL